MTSNQADADPQSAKISRAIKAISRFLARAVSTLTHIPNP